MKRATLLVVLASLAATVVLATAAHAYPVGAYSKIYEGVEYATGYTTSPRLMRAFAIRVSLKNPDVGMYASHDNGGSPYEVALQTTPAFLSEHGLKAAINTCFFDAGLSPNTTIQGLLVSNGSVVSPPDYGAPFNSYVSFTGDKSAIVSAGNSVPAGCYNAVAGAERLLNNGANVGSNTDVQPRTALGVSQDGKYAIMVCVDGRQPGWSDGVNHPELAQWMYDFGAWNAILMDGGGSTTMVRADAGTVNSPCYGYARSVGASLGVSSSGSHTQGPAACSMNSGRIDVTYRGNMNNIYYKTWTSSGGWSGAMNLGGTTYDSPGIVSRANGCLEIFHRGTTNQLYHAYNNGGGWSGWYSLGGTITTAPSACKRGSNYSMEVVARGASNEVQHIAWHSDTGWGSWENMGGTCADAPCIVSRSSNHMEIFYRGLDNQLYHNYWTSGTGWSGWYGMGGSIASAPNVVARDANHMEVFARGTGGDMQHIYWDNVNGWSPWSSLGGIVSRVGVCSTDANTMHTFHRSTMDRLVQKTWTSVGGWGGWIDLGTFFD